MYFARLCEYLNRSQDQSLPAMSVGPRIPQSSSARVPQRTADSASGFTLLVLQLMGRWSGNFPGTVQRTCGYNCTCTYNCTDQYSASLRLRILLTTRPNTVRMRVTLREVWGFPGGAAEDSVRIMGYDVSTRHTDLVFKGRNFQVVLRSSIPEDDIRLPRNVGIRLPSDTASYARSTESAMWICFTYDNVNTITFLNICSSGQRVV